MADLMLLSATKATVESDLLRKNRHENLSVLTTLLGCYMAAGAT